MQKTINKARELLVRQEISSFKTDVARMRFDREIIFDTFQNYAKTTGVPLSVFGQIKDGCTVKKGNVHIILTRDRSPPALHRSNSGSGARGAKLNRINWTLAHEVGHVMLGHSEDGAEEEIQANSFASELLTPELVILELTSRLKRSLRAYEVVKLFGVSQKAAENRIAQIGRRSRFSAYLKRELAEKYEPLISGYVKGARAKSTVYFY